MKIVYLLYLALSDMLPEPHLSYSVCKASNIRITFNNYMEGSGSATSYNTSSVYCPELAPSTVSFTGDWVRGDDSKQNSYYTVSTFVMHTFFFVMI